MSSEAKPVSAVPFVLGELAFALVALPIYIIFVIPEQTPLVLPGIWPLYNAELGLIPCILIAIIALLLSILMCNLTIKFAGLDSLITPELREFAAMFTLPQAAMIYLAAGIGEEFLFRGVCLELGGLLIATVLFTLIHIAYWKQPILLAMVFVLALLLGVVYLVTDSLVVCILIHFAYNLFVTKQVMSALTNSEES